MRRNWTSMLLAALCSSAACAAAPDRTDHPLLSAYAGSDLRKKSVQEFAEYRAFTGVDPAVGGPAGPTLQGTVTRLFYKNPKQRSVLEIAGNYEAALRRAGAGILYRCDQSRLQCVERYAQRVLNDFNDISVISNTAGSYLLAELKREPHTAYLAVAVGPGFTQVDVVELQAMDTGMVQVNAAMLGAGLDDQGYVVVGGIYFDTDKTTLKAESAAALEQVSRLLEQRPELRVYVVGHTDMQGSLRHNMALSQGRAEAVVHALRTDYGVAADRLEGHGVGPLAPQAGNTSALGRSQNRRVVLVAR